MHYFYFANKTALAAGPCVVLVFAVWDWAWRKVDGGAKGEWAGSEEEKSIV